jgi:hypothetical protein
LINKKTLEVDSMEKLRIPKELKGKELTAFLVEKLDELADSICQDEEQLLAFVKRWTGGFITIP